ncbi:MAG TPA: methyltransferase domain-containing protein [Candidatus Acidoferrales bacterium]|nr:methyltransferase domain-containing protein [Candidatus Acidoferrales bacterium]
MSVFGRLAHIEFLRLWSYYFGGLKDMLRRSLILLLALCASVALPCRAQDSWHQEAGQLASLLKWHEGSVVADIGAGKGQLTLAAAERIAPTGKIYSTELDSQEVDALKELAKNQTSITVVQAAEASTNLPSACCDSIFMRLVYHHLTKPAEIDASLFQSLKSGGRLAVIDENPRPGSSIPPGVPPNRVGHGIPQKILIRELTAAGFRVETIENTWPAGDPYHPMYCVVFLKPAS